MPPFCFATMGTGIDAPALKACGANVLGSQLQIAQRAHKSAATLAASLKHFVRMEKACGLVRHCRRRARVLPQRRPQPDLQSLLTVRTTLPPRLCLERRYIPAAAWTQNSSKGWPGRRRAERFGDTLTRGEEIDVQARLCL